MLSHLDIIKLVGDDKLPLVNHTVFTHNGKMIHKRARCGYDRVCFCFNALILLNYRPNLSLLVISYEHRLWFKQENKFTLQSINVQGRCMLSVT